MRRWEEKTVTKKVTKVTPPDPVFHSSNITKVINCLMWEGKRSTAQNIVYGALEQIGKKLKDVPPIEVFETALNNVKPLVEVRSKRIGGATYQVPTPVNEKRQLALAIRWLREAARGKKGRPMAVRLADELISAYKKEGAAITKRENTHKMAEANKAFAHFAR